jgi:hypothetical protein
MKELGIIFWGVLQLAGCSVGTPPINEIARIETLTARTACVGELSRWHREYYYQPGNFGVNKAAITVDYVRAGYRGNKAGRYIVEPPTTLIIDDAHHAFAWGTWDRSSGRFKQWECGCAWGMSSNPAGPPNCEADSS